MRKCRPGRITRTININAMSYFEEIEDWLSELFLSGEEDDEEAYFARVKREIKAKILESYRNGQKAGPPQEKPTRKDASGARPSFWPRKRGGR